MHAVVVSILFLFMLQALVTRVLEEADLDDDGMLAFAEFEHVISKSADFAE